MLKFLPIIVFFSHSLFAAATYEGKPLPDDPAERCEIAVIEMIRLMEESINNTKNVKRINERKASIEDWKKRMDKGENACELYQDIFNASFT